jgi:hypothetical protein
MNDQPQAHRRTISLPPDVLVQRLPEEELVLLELTTEQYFGLDPTGTAMWDALVDTGEVDAARERLEREFDVPGEVLEHDLDELVERLASRGLLRVGDDPTGADPAAQAH